MHKYLHILLVTLILVASPPLHAEKIYQWKDKDGQVHFGTQPPIPEKTKIVGETGNSASAGSSEIKSSDAITASQLAGHWEGQRLGKNIQLVFDKKGRFIETVNYRKPGQTPRFKRSYGGYWSLNKRRINFDIRYRDQGAQFIQPINYASTIEYRQGTLTLVWDDEAEILVKQYRKGFPAIPSEY